MDESGFKIGRCRIGSQAPCFVIAEAGVNHNGSIDLALQLVETAARSGADAVKFQTFQASKLVTADAPKADYQKRNTGNEQSQFEMLKSLELSAEQHRILFRRCEELGILFLSTPFDEASADLLGKLGVAAFKIPSGEITNIPYLQHVASFGKPMIISTGMCRLAEVEVAVETVEAAGCKEYVILHCVSNYPAAAEDVNLRAMQTLGTAFDAPYGYSDHTNGIEVSLAAVALGACVIEKHFTLDRALPGPDHAASLEPMELATLMRGIRTVEAALGSPRKRPTQAEANTAAVARKSLVAARDMPAGTRLDDAAIAIKRPGTGLPPAMRPHLLNRQLRRPIKAGTLLSLDDIA